MKENISKILEEIHSIADMIYQQKQQDAIQKFALLLNEITTVSEQIFNLKHNGILNSFDEQTYLNTLTEAMKALEIRDDVLLADILNYDLVEQFEEIKKQL